MGEEFKDWSEGGVVVNAGFGKGHRALGVLGYGWRCTCV